MRLSAWLTTATIAVTVAGCDRGVTDATAPDGALIDATPPSDDAATGEDGGPVGPSTRVIGYLPNYSGSYADWAERIDFAKMTHLNLAFALPNENNDWNMGASDGEVQALVDAAHAAGVKVLASLGGGGGDQAVIRRYRDADNIGPLVAELDDFVAAHDFDGVDIDIEDPNNLGDNYSLFVDAVIDTLRPQGKLVTAAVAQYLQDSMSDDTLHAYDFVNVMIYTNYEDSVNQLAWYVDTKQVPPDELTLGAAFFGTDDDWGYYAYRDILNADDNAWAYDQTTVNGRTVRYTGVESMKALAEYSKSFGGIMFWDLSGDVEGAHSLYRAIQETM